MGEIERVGLDLGAMVAARTAAPFGVGRARAGIRELEHDRAGVTGFTGLVLGAIGLGADDLEALTAAQVVVTIARQTRPELGVVVSSSVEPPFLLAFGPMRIVGSSAKVSEDGRRIMKSHWGPAQNRSCLDRARFLRRVPQLRIRIGDPWPRDS